MSNFRLKKILLNVFFVSALLLCFFLFRLFEQRNLSHVGQNISAMLRNEVNLSNSYAISKTIFDLESLGLFKCSKLIEINNEHRVFYDSTSNQNCNGLKTYFQRGNTLLLKGLNGLSYELYFIKPSNLFAYALEGLIYLILIFLGIYLPRTFYRSIEKEKSKNAILEIERKTLYESAKQVSHDIASPLSAIQMMTSLLHNVDPEIKNVLDKAIIRTKHIFEDLQAINRRSGHIDVQNCVKEILSEKRVRWPLGPDILLKESSEISIKAIGAESDFKRILSNLLNNAQEAISPAKKGSIEVEISFILDRFKILISDNGKGISAENLKRIGTKGFSVGKQTYTSAGSGLGVHHAMTTLNSWGGDLIFKSKVGDGTSVEISLVAAF